jgi:MazG family protein
MNNSLSEKFMKLVEIMDRLRKECPWDKEQTHESLRKYILEEAYEVVETIDKHNWDELGEELGDLLLQVVFQAAIGKETGKFSLESIIETLNNKLIERHPHIFGNKKVHSAKDVQINWEQIKIKNSNRKSLMEGIPSTAPALLRAQRIQERAAKVSFDWSQLSDVVDKLAEELQELKSAISKNKQKQIEEEMGDILFSLVNISRFLDISAEDSLRKSNEKFIRRFKYIEEAYDNNYDQMKKAGLDELDKKWEEAKKREGL